MKIDGDDGLYDFALPGLLDIVGYGVGDRIQFNYLETDSSPIPVESIGDASSAGSGSPVPGGASSSPEASGQAENSQQAAQEGAGTVNGPEDAQARP